MRNTDLVASGDEQTRAALLRVAADEERARADELVASRREEEKAEWAQWREGLREAATPPQVRDLAGLLAGQANLRPALSALRLPQPTHWYTDGSVTYGQLDTQLLRFVSSEEKGHVVRLSHGGEVRVQGAADLLRARPSPLGDMRLLSANTVRLTGSRLLILMRALSALAILCLGIGAMTLWMPVAYLISEFGVMSVLSVLGFAAVMAGAWYLWRSMESHEVQAAWLWWWARRRGVRLD